MFQLATRKGFEIGVDGNGDGFVFVLKTAE
jgi:hypothetical protein